LTLRGSGHRIVSIPAKHDHPAALTCGRILAMFKLAAVEWRQNSIR
jgi:hypothetical protein